MLLNIAGFKIPITKENRRHSYQCRYICKIDIEIGSVNQTHYRIEKEPDKKWNYNRFITPHLFFGECMFGQIELHNKVTGTCCSQRSKYKAKDSFYFFRQQFCLPESLCYCLVVNSKWIKHPCYSPKHAHQGK